MTQRLFVSAVSDSYRATRLWLAEQLRTTGSGVIIQEELIELGQSPLVKLAKSIQTESDIVLHLVGPKSGSVPPADYLPKLLAHCGERPLRQRFPKLFENDAYLRVTYTQWEAWLALFYKKHFLLCQDTAPTGEAVVPAAPDRSPPMLVADHIRLLKAEGGYAIEFANQAELLDQIKSALIRLLNQGNTPRVDLRKYVDGQLDWLRLRELDRYHLDIFAQWKKVQQDGQLKSVEESVSQLLDEPRILLFGSPGSGKTVFMLGAFKSRCEALQKALGEATVPEKLVIPVYVELGLFDPPLLSLSALILNRLGLKTGENADETLADQLSEYGLALFLDGLNELTAKRRDACAKAITDLQHLLENRGLEVSVLLTTRPYNFGAALTKHFRDENFLHADVLPLTAEQIDRYLISRLGAEAGQGFNSTIGRKVRALLSTPQHIDYALLCFEDPSGDRTFLQTRGGLLDYFIRKKKMGTLTGAIRFHLVDRILRRLAYPSNSGGVYFPYEDVEKAIKETLVLGKYNETVNDLFDDITRADLLTPSDDATHYRFPHHAHQQYFVACEMKTRLQAECQTYLTSEVWHEPLVIMAGLLDDREVRRLLVAVRPNRQLYAYVLANIHQPELEKAFQESEANSFVRDLRFRIRGLGWMLALLFGGWVLSLPFVAYALQELWPPFAERSGIAWRGFSLASLAVSCLALSYLLALPIALHRAYRQWLGRQLAVFRKIKLPGLLGVLRYLDAERTLSQLENELYRLRAKLPWRLKTVNVEGHFFAKAILAAMNERSPLCEGLPDDPKWEFIEHALSGIAEAIRAKSLLTEDEILENIGDPLIAVRVIVENLSEKGIARLEGKARTGVDRRQTNISLNILCEMYAKCGEQRDRLTELFVDLASNVAYSRRHRMQAAKICRRFGIALPRELVPRQGLCGRFWHWVRQLLGFQ